MHPFRALPGVLLLTLAVACGDDAPSQTMVRVSLGAGLDAARYEVQVVVTGQSPESEQDFADTVARDAFPLCIAVVPVDDDAARTFAARVEIRDGGDLVASREIETGFVEGEIRVAELELIACTPGSCGPTLQREPASLAIYDQGSCSDDSGDAGVEDAGPSDTSELSDVQAPDASDAGRCIAAPGTRCGFAEVFDVAAEGSLRRGFFADERLILYGAVSDGVAVNQVWPRAERLGQYSATSEGTVVPLSAVGGAFVEEGACVAVTTPPTQVFSLANGGAPFGGDVMGLNRFLLCDDASSTTNAQVGPTSGFAMGPRGADALYFYEFEDSRWFLLNSSLGNSRGGLTDLLVRGDGDNNLDCASASFSGNWTTNHTNPDLRASYEANGQDAMTTCKVDDANPSHAYHFGGSGDEEVLALFVDSSQVFVLVAHTEALDLGIQQGDSVTVASAAGWTVLALSTEELMWSRSYTAPTTLQLLGDELVVAELTTGSTNLHRFSADRLGSDLGRDEIAGLWSLVASENEPTRTRKLGLVSASDTGAARVLVLDSP